MPLSKVYRVRQKTMSGGVESLLLGKNPQNCLTQAQHRQSGDDPRFGDG